VNSLARIILPVDFSERSAGAAHAARMLALHFHSEVVVAHVLEPLFSDLGGMEITGVMLADVYKAREQQVRRQLEAFSAKELDGVEVRRVVLAGDPASSIVKLAHEELAGLVTLPTHGYGRFRRFILGSTTAKVLHDADCPVWTGVHLETMPSTLKMPERVLCALDLEEHSAATLRWASWLAQALAAKLTLIHAVTAPDRKAGEDAQSKEDEAEGEMLVLQRDTGVDADLLLESGEPAHVICSSAARLGSDVLVIGRGSATGAIGRLRANAYAIIRQSPCPVVSV
jgi:nucleotide-binding universal stress UspA family protein